MRCAARIAKDRVSTAISRWLTIARLSRCRNSIGFSMVMTCAERVAFTCSSSAASVVLLPLPVGPVTSTRPRSSSAMAFSTGGSPSSSSVFDRDRDDAEHHANRAALLEDVTAEPAQAGNAVGEIMSCVSMNFCR